eukprot:NODE_18_length_3799_cov_48.718933_g16_i0.p1 GENE.NODE_18_length_3799_cov_48.718933_g16_i0~~NODE_18_length_3799_cov_48.718933_g16_i0.p1  ORF type:complete len:799 (+),score=217.49 NODE_18_length_3799_cov_48.718933_g16_i0:606-3002(+)
MAKFKNFLPKVCSVYRNGELTEVESKNVVRGDIISVKLGDNIPADLVMIETQGDMKVDNSSLTGETEQLLRTADQDPNGKLLETPRVSFSGTECKNGSGVGMVFGIGDKTVIGSIANLADQAESAETPLSIEIHRFILIVSAVAIFLGVTFFIFGIAYGYDIITNLVFAIGIIVANVPEGLLATVTVSLALTAQRMAKKYVLVKNLESVETLGSTSCICSDKTGTLTQNVMTVSQLVYDNKRFDASINYSEYKHASLADKFTDKEPGYNMSEKGFQVLMRAIALSTTAQFNYKLEEKDLKEAHTREMQSGEKETNFEKFATKYLESLPTRPDTQKYVMGDASETGLVKFTNSVLYKDVREGLDKAREEFPIVEQKSGPCQILFNSANKFNLCIRKMGNAPEGDFGANGFRHMTVFMKGAPERIISRCKKILINGVETDISQTHIDTINEENSNMGNDGERVLAFAHCHLEPEKYTSSYAFKMEYYRNYTKEDAEKGNTNFEGFFPMHGLTFIGLVSLNDPPRFRVDKSVQKCRKAGIKVIMVTGDQKPTAGAIARKVNILTDLDKTVDAVLAANALLPVKERKTDKECFDEARGIVVHGDELAKKFREEENMPDDAPDKGRYLLDWIRKDEIVFARTSPSQKLQIVAACQRAGYVVAVTGDGVNDSPAIKKADIGVAMGSGSDVANNAADMILLNDDFSSIVNGVEEGRLIFDNLKKSIAYTLSSNIPEISPFIMFILFQVPLPLSTVLILCIDLGTDMVPAISFAYENAELDIMERMPRNSKRDHLVNIKLISFAYL